MTECVYVFSFLFVLFFGGWEGGHLCGEEQRSRHWSRTGVYTSARSE